MERTAMWIPGWKRIWKGFWQLADPKVWLASTVPMLVAAVMAWRDTGRIPVFWLLAAMAGVYLIEIGKNAVNEFVDYESGVDRFVEPDKRTPFSGGKKTIVDGLLTVRETRWIAAATLAAAFVVGTAIAVWREPDIFWIGVLGLLLAVFYTLPPLKLSYRGWGEVTVGLTFGPLLLTGMYWVLAGTFAWKAIAAGVPLAFLIANVLWINQYPDYEADLKGNKRNGLVRLGKEKGLIVYRLLFVAAYAGLAALTLIDRNPFWLLGCLSIPWAVKAVRVAAAFKDDIPRLMKANACTLTVYQVTGLGMMLAAGLFG
ncbi:MAG: 1,4-dihydroxy-2-naphthoate octaprenyltransferase [Thermobacillus sp. ZCTH02-B1]|uniref:prenyltransferase n=1 Tax=Thermobacillus sp. ZCTH02-B1 TaxID=1858795 RepID=UPI000B5502B4|nr:prenyltransferase [Thermobacillus sp. ZCTH02-B1]OUM94582.1 MAG: 1,4-dihydroxy-2-naphthoate octaprenyltransferase [Thermobacillus sp. ZCTH02-B1]